MSIMVKKSTIEDIIMPGAIQKLPDDLVLFKGLRQNNLVGLLGIARIQVDNSYSDF